LQGRADIVINITHTHTHLRTHAHARTHTHQTNTQTAGTEHTPAFIRHRSCCVTTPLQRPRAVRACTARGSRSGGRRGYGAAATSAPSARSSAASAAASGSAASACSRPACVAAASWPSVPDSVVKPLRAGALGPGHERLACPDTSQRGSSTPGRAKFALAQERQKWKAHHPHHSCLSNQINDQGQRVCARFVRACSLERLSRNAFSFHAVQQRQPVLQHVMQDTMKPSNTSVITVRCWFARFPVQQQRRTGPGAAGALALLQWPERRAAAGPPAAPGWRPPQQRAPAHTTNCAHRLRLGSWPQMAGAQAQPSTGSGRHT